jgi:hypothetical protein
MTRVFRWSVVGTLTVAFGVATFATPIREKDGRDRARQALLAAVAATERARMAQVANIVATERRIVDADAVHSVADVAALTAAAEHEQAAYEEVVRLEVVLRSELALAESAAQP